MACNNCSGCRSGCGGGCGGCGSRRPAMPTSQFPGPYSGNNSFCKGTTTFKQSCPGGCLTRVGNEYRCNMCGGGCGGGQPSKPYCPYAK